MESRTQLSLFLDPQIPNLSFSNSLSWQGERARGEESHSQVYFSLFPFQYFKISSQAISSLEVEW